MNQTTLTNHGATVALPTPDTLFPLPPVGARVRWTESARLQNGNRETVTEGRVIEHTPNGFWATHPRKIQGQWIGRTGFEIVPDDERPAWADFGKPQIPNPID